VITFEKSLDLDPTPFLSFSIEKFPLAPLLKFQKIKVPNAQPQAPSDFILVIFWEQNFVKKIFGLTPSLVF
jgi:alpha-amylase/alpha-mannosidase (GH57 family)